MPHDVFISYSSHDKPVADAVCARLEASRARCWIASRDIIPGHEWGESIVAALHEARVMVLVFSNNANVSPQVKREVERAVHWGLIIIPFRIEDVLPASSLEYYLGTPHWLDALTPPLEAHLERLAAVVTGFLQGTIPESERFDGPPAGWSAPGQRRRIRPELVGIGAVLIVIIYLLFAALAGIAPFPASSNSNSGSPPASSLTTTVETYTPWTTTDQISPDVTVGSPESGSCSQSSSSAPGDPLAFRCSVGGGILDPCIAPPGETTPVSQLACPSAPWGSVTLLNLTSPVTPPVSGNGPNTPTWALQLANGQKCVVSDGANAGPGGVNLTYDCGTDESGGQTSSLDDKSEPWTVQYLPQGGDSLTTVDVTVAWAA